MYGRGENEMVVDSKWLGEEALGSLLVVGFTLHNLTEGIGIAFRTGQNKTFVSYFSQLKRFSRDTCGIGSYFLALYKVVRYPIGFIFFY